jgi:hypothetical protein
VHSMLDAKDPAGQGPGPRRPGPDGAYSRRAV